MKANAIFQTTPSVPSAAQSAKSATERNLQQTKFLKMIFSPSNVQFLTDTITLCIAYALYYIFRMESGLFLNRVEPTFTEMATAGIALLLFWYLLFWFAGLYRNWYHRSPFEEFATVFKTSFWGCIILFLFIFIDDLQSPSSTQASSNPRLLILLYWIMIATFVSSGRFAARLLQRKLRTTSVITFPTLLIGTLREVNTFAESLKKAPALGYRVIGALIPEEERKQQTQSSIPVLGTFSDLNHILERYQPEVAIITLEQNHSEDLLSLVHTVQQAGTSVKIVPNLYEVFSGQVRTQQIYGTPLIEVSSHLMQPWEMFAKRTLDILVSLIILIGGLPLWLLIALLIKIDSRGPIFYTQDRVGKNGKIFRLYKFRSMVADAERTGPRWAQENDPRVTRVGKWLRRTHLDEIPQFWNILKGDMSLVGPRPERPYFVEKYSKIIPYYKRRLVVRQGLTGWNQIKRIDYKNETLEIVRERLRHDFYYIENMSFKLDLEIILRTILLILRGKGTT